MNAWFESLQARERVFVIAAAIAIVFAVFWFALWQPLARSEADLGARIQNWQTSLQELRPLRGRLLAAGSQNTGAAAQNQSLVVIVDNTLRSRNLYSSLQRSQPTNNNGIRVEFDNVSFDDLVLWLGDLDNRYGLNVQTASFSQSTSNNPGRINASLTLERA
jgi:general secretion pathway protein M